MSNWIYVISAHAITWVAIALYLGRVASLRRKHEQSSR